MIYYRYSDQQLESKAEELLQRFDPERLYKAKPIDVYAVVEKCLGVPYDWKYLTPDQSILGMTLFKAGYLWVWPKPYYEEGMLPYKAEYEANTILIDSTLTESEQRGPENFTVMHETFHQVLHRRCFLHCNPDYTHASSKAALTGQRRGMTALDINERQANFCAATFLMPRQLLTDTFRKLYPSGMISLESDGAYRIIKVLSEDFSVSPFAMKYRLQYLHLAD